MPSFHGSRRRIAPRGSGRRSLAPYPSENSIDIDPALFFGTNSEPAIDRKTFQLCKQAARALTIALAAECGDEVLRDVYVDSVQPAPDASRLLVTVRPLSAAGPDPDVVLERLLVRRPFLRSCITSAIHRKRTPELSFCVAGVEDGS